MAKSKKKASDKKLNSSRSSLPAISVIIAMYNTEKYIGECLDSLLAQTFTNFEIIVVDDCSTDNSNAIVQSYVEKFDGRLNLLRLKKNSGNNGIPNNTGLALSRGDYVIFLDSDDAITADALEKLYTVAEKFNADVVGTEKYFEVPDKFWNDSTFRKQLKPYSYQRGGFVNEPVLITEDFSLRVRECAQKRFIWNIWSKLIRRDFLIENEISITNEMANDMLLTCFLVYSAKKYVRVPYVINFYRVVESSLTHQKRDPFKQMKKYINALTVGFEHLDNFLSDREIFQKNPSAKYTALNTYFQEILTYLNDIYSKIPAHDLDYLLREEFSKGDNTALSSFLFNVMNIYRFNLIKSQQQVNQFASQAQARISELEAEIKRLKGLLK